MTPSAAGAKDGGITLLQLLVAVAAVLAATTALTSHPAARSLRRVAPRPRARVMAGGNMTVGWRDTHNLDRLGDESPEDERLLSLLDSGLRGFSSNMGWLPADERQDLPLGFTRSLVIKTAGALQSVVVMFSAVKTLR